MRVILFLAALVLLADASSNHSFVISPDGKSFLKDGQKIQLVSGSIHYFRSSPSQWNARLSAARAAGLNAIQFYVPWNFHSPSPGVFDFTLRRDLSRFLDLAYQNNLLVMMRLGPYVCGEWDFGGFPWYMIQKYPQGLPIRTSNASYMAMVTDWWSSLLPYIKPYTYNANGGPIVMLQIENEYGSYGSDHVYLGMLRDMVKSVITDNTILYSTDGGATGYTVNTAIPGVFQVVDFGPGADLNSAFSAQHVYNYVKGPDVNAEYYPGWLTHWGDNTMAQSGTDGMIATLDAMLLRGASVNFYMFHGGSNNEFWSGANGGGDGGIQYTVQSYDYDSPLTEAGDPTSKYFAIRNVVGKYLPLPNVPLPIMQPKAAYGVVSLPSAVPVLTAVAALADTHMTFTGYAAMEVVGQPFGFVAYSTNVNMPQAGPYMLDFVQPRDYLVVYVNGARQGAVLRGTNSSLSVVLTGGTDNLTVLAENCGRVNYGSGTYDPKGMISVWSLGGKPMTDAVWTAVGTTFRNASQGVPVWGSRGAVTKGTPLLLQGTFTIANTAALLDTFLDMRGWGKGYVLVNDFNVGRFWEIGPQYSLYVASERLVVGVNTVVVMDLLGDRGLPIVFDSVPHDKRQDDPYTKAPQ